MTKRFGPSFFEELSSAGLAGLPFSWSEDGTINGLEDLTTKQNAALAGVIERHVPDALPVAALKAEAGSVISSVVSATAQLNLNAAMNVIGAKSASARSADEKAFAETFAEGHAWIQSVRARMHELYANKGLTPDGEVRWPEPSMAVRDLAERY
jgi:hypothetical protein